MVKKKQAKKPKGKQEKKSPSVKKKAPKKKSGGQPGPKPNRRKIVPNDYEMMMRMYGTGHTYQQIADKLGCSQPTVSLCFKNRIFPLTQASSSGSINSELVKIDAMERVAWKAYFEGLPAETRETVKNQVEKLQRLQDNDKLFGVEQLLEETFTTIVRAQDKVWIAAVQWCIDMRCKLRGHYKLPSLKIDMDEFRVAGQSGAENMLSIQIRFTSALKEMRARDAQLERDGVSLGQITRPSRN